METGTLERAASPGQENPGTGTSAGPQNVRRYWAVRLLFGLIWGIDATLKWLPGFRDHFLAMIQASAQGQPSWLAPFFHFAAGAVRPAPGLFAVLTALAETAICLSLLLGLAQRASFIFGAVFGLAIWGSGRGLRRSLPERIDGYRLRGHVLRALCRAAARRAPCHPRRRAFAGLPARQPLAATGTADLRLGPLAAGPAQRGWAGPDAALRTTPLSCPAGHRGLPTGGRHGRGSR